MKKISVPLLFLAAVGLMQSCGDNSSTTTSSTTSDTTATTSVDTSTNKMADTTSTANKMTDTTSMKMSGQNPDKDATDFIMKAASGGMMEVELGKVAQEKAKNQRVKDFGSMMVSDHTKANDELKSIASSKNVTIPASMMPAHQKHVDMLKSKSGAEFDKAYMSMMLDDHKEDVADFKKTSEKSTDTDVKNFAGKTLPVLEKHLDSAKAIHASKM